jgi:hypothetical protein
MTPLIPLAVLALLAAQPADNASDDGPPPAQPTSPSGQAAPTIDSILTQEPPTEDAREAAVRAAFAAAEALRGGLDGRWRVSSSDGVALYVFQFADSGVSPDPRSSTPWTPTIEGAWRDLQREGAVDNSGFINSIQRDGASLVIRFFNRDPVHAEVLTLSLQAGGAWRGSLDGAGHRVVVMNRL